MVGQFHRDSSSQGLKSFPFSTSRRYMSSWSTAGGLGHSYIQTQDGWPMERVPPPPTAVSGPPCSWQPQGVPATRPLCAAPLDAGPHISEGANPFWAPSSLSQRTPENPHLIVLAMSVLARSVLSAKRPASSWTQVSAQFPCVLYAMQQQTGTVRAALSACFCQKLLVIANNAKMVWYKIHMYL